MIWRIVVWRIVVQPFRRRVARISQSKALSRSQLILRECEDIEMFCESILEAPVRRLAFRNAATEFGSGGRKD